MRRAKEVPHRTGLCAKDNQQWGLNGGEINRAGSSWRTRGRWPRLTAKKSTTPDVMIIAREFDCQQRFPKLNTRSAKCLCALGHPAGGRTTEPWQLPSLQPAESGCGESTTRVLHCVAFRQQTDHALVHFVGYVLQQVAI